MPTIFADDFFRGNKYEVQILRNFVHLNQKLTTYQLFQHLLKEYVEKDKFKYKINRSILLNNPPSKL